MEVIVIEKEAFNKLIEEMTIKIIQEVEKRYKGDEWISAEQAKELLGVKSKSKLQQLRDEFKIEFSQFGKIIRYSRTSILRFLEKHRVSIEGYVD